MTDVTILWVTAPDADTAARLARTVVEERLAACGNLLTGVRSIYRWQGAVHDEAEAMLVLKTTRAGAERLRERIVELHPYSCPEVLALPVVEGHAPYLAWVAGQVGPESPSGG